MQLDAKTTALVLIDLQKGVLGMPVAPHSAAAVYERSRRLADRFRAANSLVVWVRVSFSSNFVDALHLPGDDAHPRGPGFVPGAAIEVRCRIGEGKHSCAYPLTLDHYVVRKPLHTFRHHGLKPDFLRPGLLPRRPACAGRPR